MSHTDLTGLWVGHYSQRGGEYPITAEFVQVADRLSGSMHDGHPDREQSVFELASNAGLPPGADEQIEARLRELVPDAGAAPIRYVSHLPAGSVLDGLTTGQTVSFLKTYQGAAFGGYRVGDKLIGVEQASQSVHYDGRLSRDGLLIEGRWWIDPDPARAIPRTEGSFTLHRQQSLENPRG